MVSVSSRCAVCGMAVVCAAVSPPRSAARPCSARASAVLISTAVMSCYCPLPGVWCVGECLSILLCAVGYPLCAPPLVVVVGGLSWMVWWHDWAGWHGDGKAGCVVLTLPLVCWRPPSVCWVVVLKGGVCVL